jgi:hypothetical protein
VRRFTVQIIREVTLEVGGDAKAVELTGALRTGVDELLGRLMPEAERGYGRSACQRGVAGKVIFDEEFLPSDAAAAGSGDAAASVQPVVHGALADPE